LLAPAEDPRERFPDAVDRRVELLDDLRAALRRVRASLRQLGERACELQERTVELDAQARGALAVGDRTGARDAVFLHELARAELDALTRQRNDLEAEARRLALGEQRLATLIDTYLAHERLTHMRHDAAETGVRIAEALAGLSDELGRPSLLDAETKIRELEARAAAIDELVAAGILDVAGDTALATAADRRLAALEAEVDERRDPLERSRLR
jgi:phage shock protein A